MYFQSGKGWKDFLMSADDWIIISGSGNGLVNVQEAWQPNKLQCNLYSRLRNRAPWPHNLNTPKSTLNEHEKKTDVKPVEVLEKMRENWNFLCFGNQNDPKLGASEAHILHTFKIAPMSV